MNERFDITSAISSAIREFWNTKNRQLIHSVDSSSRGSVTAGKQMDGFLKLLREACLSIGIPQNCIYDRNNYIPGYFRSSKDWDFLIVSPEGKLLVVVELKSQVGSYGNNFNNRAEEALGCATDFWTAFREKQFPTSGSPWIGYLMVIGDDAKSNASVKNYENHYPVRSEFVNASYIDRYRILCEKLVLERLYTSTALVSTQDSETFSCVSDNLSVERFIKSMQGYLRGCLDEFER